MVIRQAEIWWADLPEPTGSEPGFPQTISDGVYTADPKKDAAAIKAEAAKLKVRAKLILGSAQSSEKPRVPGAKALLDGVTTLEEAVAAKDDMAVLEALRLVHDAYEKLAEGHN